MARRKTHCPYCNKVAPTYYHVLNCKKNTTLKPVEQIKAGEQHGFHSQRNNTENKKQNPDSESVSGDRNGRDNHNKFEIGVEMKDEGTLEID